MKPLSSRSSLSRSSVLAGALWMAPGLAVAQAPVPTPEFAPYIEVRTITTSLAGTAPQGSYITRRLAYDRGGGFGGRVVVATNVYGAEPGRIDVVDPATGAIAPLGGPDLHLPKDVAVPWANTGFAAGAYYFQQFDFTKEPYVGRRVYVLAPGSGAGLGNVLSTQGMDSGTGLAFAPPGFGKFAGHLFGADSGNAPGYASGDGLRRWDAAGNFTNEVMGPTEKNPDTYSDVTFTGAEFGVYANRLVAINTTGVKGENILMWKETAILGDDPKAAYDARQVFATDLKAEPVARATYGAYGYKGYLFAMSQGTVYRYDSTGARAAFLTAVPGFNDVEFGARRTLYVADLYGGLYEVRPSAKVFTGWAQRTGCGLVAKGIAEVTATWQVEACPGARLVCEAVKTSCGGCVTPAMRDTVIAAVGAICGYPC